MKAIYESRRAQFLKSILDALDSEDAIAMGDLVNDEQVNFWPLKWWLDGNEEFSSADQEAIGEMLKESRKLLGRIDSSKRASVNPQQLNDDIMKAWERCLERLSPKGKRVFPSVLELMDMGNLESLDARYAHEVIEVLGKIIVRVGKLPALKPLSLPNRSVQLAFEEAHRCYLYGFSTACAVLCRATVESSLREALEAADHKYLSDDMDFSDMLHLEAAKRLLGGLLRAADETRRAGNDAVHHASAFRETISVRQGARTVVEN